MAQPGAQPGLALTPSKTLGEVIDLTLASSPGLDAASPFPVMLQDSDGATVFYSFQDALFLHSFRFFLAGGILTRGLLLYILCIISATLLTALCACNADGVTSHLLGGAGCWRNSYSATWSDMTLNVLTAFLLGLLVNNVLCAFAPASMCHMHGCIANPRNRNPPFPHPQPAGGLPG
jgi:hypothetical protein